MKRQPKPFAVEIKRSRRSPGAPGPVPVSAPEPDGNAGEPAYSTHFLAHSPEADLVIPAFLQSAKDVRRPSTRERSDIAASDRDKVFAPMPQAEPDEAIERARPRVLPSLVPAPGFEQQDQQIKTRRPRAAKNPEPAQKTDEPARKVAAEKTPVKRNAPPPLLASAPPEPRFDNIQPPQLTRSRMFLPLRRAEAAALPLGQRWKRRLHPRAW